VEDVRKLPSVLILPIPLIGEEVEITLEYEGIPSQCSKCLGLDHATEECCNTTHNHQKKPVGGKMGNTATGNQ
jgi:hypothetical protein